MEKFGLTVGRIILLAISLQKIAQNVMVLATFPPNLNSQSPQRGY